MYPETTSALPSANVVTVGYQAARYLLVLAAATFEYGLGFTAASTAWTRNR